MSGDGLIRLNLNECPYPPPRPVIDRVREVASLMNRYDYADLNESLINLLSGYVGIEPEYIKLLPGSESFMLYSALHFRSLGLYVVSPSPAFEPALIDFESAGVPVIRVPLDDDLLLNEELTLRFASKGGVLYVSNPNNPTGNLIVNEGFLREALEKFRYVIVDEAYFEFSGITFKDWISSYDNLIILRTLSKAFAIAGARLGYVLGRPQTLHEVLSKKRAFDIPITSIAAGIGALESLEIIREYVNNIVKIRENTVSSLNKIRGVKVRDSVTNFILVGMDGIQGKELHAKLMKRGIIVKPLTHEKLQEYVRVTIGTEDEMNYFIGAIEEISESLQQNQRYSQT